MIKRYEDHKIDLKTPKPGDNSAATLFRIIEKPEELYGKGRLFSIVTVDPGEEISYHQHVGDGEYYHILSGEGRYNENGRMTVLHEGDTAFCPDGEWHGIRNEGEELLVFIALIIYN